MIGINAEIVNVMKDSILYPWKKVVIRPLAGAGFD